MQNVMVSYTYKDTILSHSVFGLLVKVGGYSAVQASLIPGS